MGKSSFWTPEKDAQLRSLHAEYGSKWQDIGPIIGAHPSNCRWRASQINLTTRTIGKSKSSNLEAIGRGQEEADLASFKKRDAKFRARLMKYHPERSIRNQLVERVMEFAQ